MTKILVTGGAGAIGLNLVDYLILNNHKVVVLDDLSSGYEDNINKESIFYHGSVLDDHLLEQVFTKHDIIYVFHLAALFANQNSIHHPEKDLMTNGLGTLKILEKSKLHGVKKVIYTSSSCVYGNMPTMEEAEPLNSRLDTPYAITKLLGEKYCQFYSDFHGLPTAIARLFNCYGPGEKPGQYRNVIPNFFSQALQGNPLIITGTGHETRDFTFVKDTVIGLYKMCFHKTNPGAIFNLGSGIQTSIQDLVDSIINITGNKSKIIYQPQRSWDHVMHRVANINKAKENLDYCPTIGIQEGLKETLLWLTMNA